MELLTKRIKIFIKSGKSKGLSRFVILRHPDIVLLKGS